MGTLTTSKPAEHPSELAKELGLTSATTLVMGSMIGSGIFIVSADIARLTNSPALLIAAWLVTGFMTIVGALSYGELAAMMPRAGGLEGRQHHDQDRSGKRRSQQCSRERALRRAELMALA